MRDGVWTEKRANSTRGRIVALLRRSRRTVSELAEALTLTDNGVRVHLTALERDGLVEQVATVRQGVGKPAHLYGLTREGEVLLSRAYAPALDLVVGAMEERLGAEETAELLRRAGQGVAAPAVGTLRERMEAAAALLVSLGGDVEVEEGPDGVLRLRGHGCPLGAVVAGHGEACRLAEGMVERVVGVPVRECCEKGERPSCRFEVDG
jgi:predicted ArsR family transcriptional regulator